MRSGFTTCESPWLLIALLAATFTLRAGAADDAPRSTGAIGGSHGKTTMSAEDWRDVPSLPPAEQRRRLDIVLAAHPDDYTARLWRMQAEQHLGDCPAVVADSASVLSSPFLDGPAQQLTLEWRSECLLHLRRFDESIAVASQLLALYPSDAEGLFTRGWAQFFVHHLDEAIADLDRALEIRPDEGVGHTRRGNVLAAQGKLELAAKDYRRAIELVPEDGPNRKEYGILLYRTRDYERAAAQLDAAARLMPNDVFTLTWLAQANRALMRFDAAAANDKRAEEAGRNADELFSALNNIAIDLEDLQDYAGAAAETARELAVQADPGAAHELARRQWFAGQFGSAVESFRRYAASPMSEAYTPLWLYVMHARADPADEPAAKAELAAQATHQPHAWTDTLVDVALGRSTLEAALAEADKSETDKLRNGRRCEADYYSAEQMLMRGQRESASRLLEEAHRVCPSTYIEARAVDAQRRLLAADSSAH